MGDDRDLEKMNVDELVVENADLDEWMGGLTSGPFSGWTDYDKIERIQARQAAIARLLSASWPRTA